MTEPVTIHLMRHGTPALTGRLLGHTDCDVTADGIAECRAAAGVVGIAGIISSDLRRAADCARAIGDDRQLPHRPDPRWRELDFGAWDGHRASEVDQAALGAFWADPDRDPPPGGERWSALTTRVGAALAETADDTLVVTHAGAIRAALAVSCGFARDQLWAFDLPYGCLVSLRLWRGEAPAAQIVALRP